MSSVTYSVSARQPQAVKADLHRLWRDNLSPATTPDERFQWLFAQAPRAIDTVLVLEALAGERRDIVGTNGLVPRDFWAAGREVRAAISCDLAVDRAHRALAPALTLVRAVRAEVATRFDLIYGFPNAKAEGVLKRAGFHEAGRAKRWVKVLRYASYVDRARAHSDLPAPVRLLSAAPSIARAAAAVADAARGAMLRLDPRRLTGRYVVHLESAPDERWDALWLAARAEFPLIGTRASAYVRWRFAPSPDVFFVTLQQRGDPRLAAYAAVQMDRSTGAAHVRDLFGHRASLAPLIDALIPVVWRAGASSVSIRFFGAPVVERLLIARGFAPREGSRAIAVAHGPALSESATLFANPDCWYLFDADEES